MKTEIISELSSKLPEKLVLDFIESYEKVLLEFRKGKWDETLWKGGKFVENTFRMLKYLLSSEVVDEISDFNNIRKDLESCPKDKLPDSIRILIPRIATAMVYDTRSKKGAIHVKPINPDFMDSNLVVATCDWIVAEFIRLYGKSDPKKLAELVNSIIERKTPFIEIHNGEKFVTRHLGSNIEIMLILLDSHEGLMRSEIGKMLGKFYKQPSITEALQKLVERRLVLQLENGKYVISGPGEIEISNILTKII